MQIFGKRYTHFLVGILCIVAFQGNAQPNYPIKKDTLSGDSFIRMVEQSLALHYADYAKIGKQDSIIKALNFDENTSPEFTDEEFCKQLAKLNEVSDFGFDCNAVSLAGIRFFAKNRRNFAKVVLGRSKLYFDLYEEKLAEYGLPLELKYLSVIESGLRPQVKSRAGALGLWQFMYATGKSYGLTENSYIDERMDPLKATDAACRYLKKLYNIYGDWNLALAAYNAGPGNVNKAIRRSGGKRTYWEIRPFLPKETQGYVPNFIATTYLLTYHLEHNILPAEAKIQYYQLDTICLQRGIHMQSIDNLVSWSIDDIQTLNPVYKTSYIPTTSPKQCITGPLEKIGLLVSLEDKLYELERKNYGSGGGNTPIITAVSTNNKSDQMVVSNPVVKTEIPKTKTITTINYTYHKVKPGESLGKIAAQYSASIEEIMEWNNLAVTDINTGQLLKIQTKVTTVIENPEYTEMVINSEKEIDSIPEEVIPPVAVNTGKKYYTIRRGDTFSKIASKSKITVAQLQRLNPGVKASRIQAGQKVRIK